MIISPGLPSLALLLRQDAEEASTLTTGIGLHTSAHSDSSSNSRQSDIDAIGPRARRCSIAHVLKNIRSPKRYEQLARCLVIFGCAALFRVIYFGRVDLLQICVLVRTRGH